MLIAIAISIYGYFLNMLYHIRSNERSRIFVKIAANLDKNNTLEFAKLESIRKIELQKEREKIHRKTRFIFELPIILLIIAIISRMLQADVITGDSFDDSQRFLSHFVNWDRIVDILSIAVLLGFLITKEASRRLDKIGRLLSEYAIMISKH
jgi:hypothetical protein